MTLLITDMFLRKPTSWNESFSLYDTIKPYLTRRSFTKAKRLVNSKDNKMKFYLLCKTQIVFAVNQE